MGTETEIWENKKFIQAWCTNQIETAKLLQAIVLYNVIVKKKSLIGRTLHFQGHARNINQTSFLQNYNKTINYLH